MANPVTNQFPFSYLAGNTDPTVVPQNGLPGFLYTQIGTAKLFIKLDSGSTTNWQQVGAGAPAAGSLAVTGSYAAPLATTGAAPINLSSDSAAIAKHILFLTSTGGLVTMTDPPIIDTSGYVGKLVQFIGTSNANAVTIQNSASFQIGGNMQLLQNRQLVVMQMQVTPTPLYIQIARF